MWAESSPWSTWTHSPDLSKTCLRKSQEWHILSFQPKVLLPSACSPCVRASWCALQSALCGSPAESALCAPPCCPAGPQLCSLLHCRREGRASAPHHTCTSQAVPRSCTCRTAEPEISASNSQKWIRTPYPALFVYRKGVRALEVPGTFLTDAFQGSVSHDFPSVYCALWKPRSINTRCQISQHLWHPLSSWARGKWHKTVCATQVRPQKEQVFNISNCFWIKLLILGTKGN